MEELGIELFAYCTDFVINISNLTGLSYYEINTLLFCVIYPTLLVVLPCFYTFQRIRLKKLKKSQGLHVLSNVTEQITYDKSKVQDKKRIKFSFKSLSLNNFLIVILVLFSFVVIDINGYISLVFFILAISLMIISLIVAWKRPTRTALILSILTYVFFIFFLFGITLMYFAFKPIETDNEFFNYNLQSTLDIKYDFNYETLCKNDFAQGFGGPDYAATCIFIFKKGEAGELKRKIEKNSNYNNIKVGHMFAFNKNELACSKSIKFEKKGYQLKKRGNSYYSILFSENGKYAIYNVNHF